MGGDQFSKNDNVQMNQNDPFDEPYSTGKLNKRDQPMDFGQIHIDKDANMNGQEAVFTPDSNPKSKNIQI